MPRQSRPLTKKEEAVILKLYKQKMPVSKISEATGRDTPAIYKLINSKGLGTPQKELNMDDGNGYLNPNCLRQIGPDATWIM